MALPVIATSQVKARQSDTELFKCRTCVQGSDSLRSAVVLTLAYVYEEYSKALAVLRDAIFGGEGVMVGRDEDFLEFFRCAENSLDGGHWVCHHTRDCNAMLHM
jgi:hypothetical protein